MDDECEEVVGSGCELFAGEVEVLCEEAPDSEEGDTAEALFAGEVGGSGAVAACQTLPSTTGLAIVIALLFAALRRNVSVLILLFATTPAFAQVDAQLHQMRAGGSWAALRDGNLGNSWGISASFGYSYARLPVVVSFEGRQVELLSAVATRSMGVALRIANTFEVGIEVPGHDLVIWRGEMVHEYQPADVRAWVAIPILESEDLRALHLAFTTEFGFATGSSDRYLGNAAGSILGTLALSKKFDNGVEGTANLGVRLLDEVALAGAVWGNSLEYGLGVRSPPLWLLHGTVELKGAVNLADTGRAASWPLEVYAAGELSLPGTNLALRMGTGTGLTRGLGSPRWRVFMALQHRERPWPDSDEDGIIDPRDACPHQPEDVDSFKDRDGCPDEDNDADGILDVVDQCPNAAEVFNDYKDSDGCPDHITLLELVIDSTDRDRLQQFALAVNDEHVIRSVGDGVEQFRVAGDLAVVRVEAAGHSDFEGEIILRGERQRHRITLDALYFSQAKVFIADADGHPLEAWIDLGGQRRGVPAVGAEFVNLPWGEQTVRAGARGYLARDLVVELPREGASTIRIQLAPAELMMTRTAIRFGDEIRFDLDSSVLSDSALPMLEALANMLLRTPEIELMRIEGHADQAGNSRHNLELSEARAASVVARLVELGVAAHRLVALGTGEARPIDDGSRRVEFLVLIWNDEVAVPKWPVE